MRDWCGDELGFAGTWCHCPPTLRPLIKAMYFCASLFFPPLLRPSTQLFFTVKAGMGLWLLGITSPSLPSCLPFFLPLSPFLSPFLPPWSHSCCFITTILPLRKQTTDTGVTSAAEGLFKTLPRSLSWSCPKLGVFLRIHDHPAVPEGD